MNAYLLIHEAGYLIHVTHEEKAAVDEMFPLYCVMQMREAHTTNTFRLKIDASTQIDVSV